MSGSQSGIAIDDECVNKFNELKLGKNVRYAIFKIADDHKSVVFEKEAPTSATWEDFVGELPRNDARYGIFDFEYEVDGGKRNKIVFVLWAPDEVGAPSPLFLSSSFGLTNPPFFFPLVSHQAEDDVHLHQGLHQEEVCRHWY
ncbi:cofilin [Balamuthia mandrillaris]